jgi:5-methyltetrahydrofolate--homocysteine methyltransferase
MVKQIFECIINFDSNTIVQKVQDALSAGIGPQEILNDGMVAAMSEVGRRFEEGSFFIPEMMVAAMTMEKGMEALQPSLIKAGVKPAGKIVIGTVKGDLHDVGKNLVAMMLRGAGFEIIDLGIDISSEQFIEATRLHNPKILALSALLTTTMPSMKDTILALEKAGLRERVKVIIGGAPLTNSYAQEIGADGYAPDAQLAVQLARTMTAMQLIQDKLTASE